MIIGIAEVFYTCAPNFKAIRSKLAEIQRFMFLKITKNEFSKNSVFIFFSQKVEIVSTNFKYKKDADFYFLHDGIFLKIF